MIRTPTSQPFPLQLPLRLVRWLLFTTLFTTSLDQVRAADTSSADGKLGASATVEFVAPEKFSDIELSDLTPKESLGHILPELTQIIQTSAAKRLPPGHSVHIRVRDIDLAGRIARATGSNLRVVGKNHAAIIEFDYTYRTPKGGESGKNGSKRLSRLPTEMDSLNASSGDLYLLRSMLDSWLQRLAKGKP